ncbi:adenylate/guanylate cyclase domain-containing protein [Rhizobium sp. 2YAF20]|uniref:adenylate/guanylate cyclase domain-containing protein n=1 Tax=Rhizobium sp. 2YAF20 TaxID=3233027 RepID=UPI003F9B7DFD
MIEETINRRLAAILVADVVGYSRMMAANETSTFEAFRQRRKTILEPVIESHSGRIVKFMGDGVLVEFASALSAAECAIELQRKMSEANSVEVDAPDIVLRIGINLGDVIGDESDIFGEGVNIAARLEGLSEPGGFCISEKVHAEVQGKLSIAIRDLGLAQLKNIAAPIRVFGMDTATPFSSIAPAPKREFTTIAVLPFANMSGNPDEEYFTDGITEDIITELGRFRNLSVVARNTMATFKGKSFIVTDIAEQLGADFVLEGSVRLAGTRMRATAQLIDAQSGAHVFAEKFDRELSDVFAVQDEIVEAIIGRMFFTLQDAAGALRQKSPTTNVSAYTLWLRAGAAWRNGDEPLARKHMNEAVKIDPHYAPALASLSLLYAYWRFSEPNLATDEERDLKSKQFAAMAISADKSDPFVLTSVAACFSLGGNISDALRYSEMAMAMSPRDSNVLVARGMIVAYAGHHEEGLALVERGCQFEPVLPPAFVSSLGDCYYLARRFEDALNAYGRLIDPPYFIRLNQAACLAQLGRNDEARYIVRQKPDWFDAELYVSISLKIFPCDGDREAWPEGFRKAGAIR